MLSDPKRRPSPAGARARAGCSRHAARCCVCRSFTCGNRSNGQTWGIYDVFPMNCGSLWRIKDVGLNRFAVAVRDQQRVLTIESWAPRMSRAPRWQELDRTSVASYNVGGPTRRSYYADEPQGRFRTLSYRPTQPQVAADLQRCVQLVDIPFVLKHSMPIYSKSVPCSRWLCLPHLTSRWPAAFASWSWPRPHLQMATTELRAV
jgi:hypothetical protein